MEIANEIITKLTESITDLNLKFTEAISELRADLQNLTKTVSEVSTTNTKRLDKHSGELDEHSDRLTKLEAYRESEEKARNRNLVIGTIVATLFSGAVATFLTLLLK